MRKAILVVDDNPMIQTLLGQVLAKYPCEVVVASDASEALTIGRTRAIDGVLTDMKLGDRTGLDLCRELKAIGDAHGRTIPVWIVSGTSAGECREELQSGEIAGFIQKPFRPADVWRQVGPIFGEALT